MGKITSAAKLIVAIFFTIFFLDGCNPTTTIMRSLDVPINKPEKDYDIVGTFRMESVGENFTYDKILSEARKQYKDNNLDVIEIKADRVATANTIPGTSSISQGHQIIVNAYVIRYK